MPESQSDTRDRERIEIDERKIERIGEGGEEKRGGEKRKKSRKTVEDREAGERKSEQCRLRTS